MANENDDIVVTGSCYDPILEEWRARPQTIDEEGVGGGGLGGGGAEHRRRRIIQKFLIQKLANAQPERQNRSRM